MATQVEVPNLGDSVTQAILVRWLKADGDTVAKDEALCELETDKANVDIRAPRAGVLRRVKEEGETVAVGEVIARVDEAGAAAAKPEAENAQPAAATAAAGSASSAPASSDTGSSNTGPSALPMPVKFPADPTSPKGPGSTPSHDNLSPAVRRLVAEHHVDPAVIPGTGPSGRLTVEDVHAFLDRAGNGANGEGDEAPPQRPAPEAKPSRVVGAGVADLPKGKGSSEKLAPPINAPPKDFDAHGERRVKMSKIRLSIAKRLVQVQQTAAILTTFNEVDLTEVMSLRSKFKERFQEVHGVGLGFMSFFARACVMALKEFPRLNASLDGDEIIYHRDIHLGIAVSTDRGLAVPVLRNIQNMSFARIESEIKRLATATRDGKLGVDELSGGTFTITNGGVFGSLLSTPILNPPQSGILGMHAIQKRPVVIDDKIEARPMMYLALSYDHRLVDGRESISFLVRLKQSLEDPARLMLEI